jgi:hypothetical protein
VERKDPATIDQRPPRLIILCGIHSLALMHGSDSKAKAETDGEGSEGLKEALDESPLARRWL